MVSEKQTNQVAYGLAEANEIKFFPKVDYNEHDACLVRCNQCMSLGYAWYGDEICPVCGYDGALMDLEEAQA